jgi:hypothetical protein
VRITSIYEGTTGIQSNDLIGRKFGRDRGAALLAFIDDMEASLAALAPLHASALHSRSAARDALVRLRKTSDLMLKALASAPDRAMAVSVPFLRFCGLTIGGWLMARAADIAAQRLASGASDREFFEAKLASAHFYSTQVLPQVLTLEHICTHGSVAVSGTDVTLI